MNTDVLPTNQPSEVPWPPAEPPATWAEFPWPEWVPANVREQVEDFWKESWGRGPMEWLRNHQNNWGNNAPAMGSVVYLCRLCSDEERVEGRLVHAWNNIARVVLPDGSVECVSFSRSDAPGAVRPPTTQDLLRAALPTWAIKVESIDVPTDKRPLKCWEVFATKEGQPRVWSSGQLMSQAAALRQLMKTLLTFATLTAEEREAVADLSKKPVVLW